MRRIFWTLQALCALALLANAALYFRGPEIALFVINAKAGCFPWSPSEVDYHDGMTLCPQQSARVRVRVPPATNGHGI